MWFLLYPNVVVYFTSIDITQQHNINSFYLVEWCRQKRLNETLKGILENSIYDSSSNSSEFETKRKSLLSGANNANAEVSKKENNNNKIRNIAKL